MDRVLLATTNRYDIGTPNGKYESLERVYKRNRAIMSGEDYVKAYDASVSNPNGLLLPFSDTMTQQQYDFYKREATYPGFVEQYARILIGGLLRKEPTLVMSDEIDEEVQEEIRSWIMNRFSHDNGSLIGFLDTALTEEFTTSRAWVCVNYPSEEIANEGSVKPYPILLEGESIINWQTEFNESTGLLELSWLVVRGFTEIERTDDYQGRGFDASAYHPNVVETVWLHEIDEEGYYVIRQFLRESDTISTVYATAGHLNTDTKDTTQDWVEIRTENNILRRGERLDFIPIYPLNGEVEPIDPMLSNIMKREIGLYNLYGRRNHLTYASSVMTPVLSGRFNEQDIQAISDAGIGTLWFLPEGGRAEILSAPTEALSHQETAIQNTIEDMAKMGMRIISQEIRSHQSGVALDIRNAPQTAQLSTFSVKISSQISKIIRTMVRWRYDIDYPDDALQFNLCSEFQTGPQGLEWARLMFEMYMANAIPQEVFTEFLRKNDLVAGDFRDDELPEPNRQIQQTNTGSYDRPASQTSS